ncbi:MAG: 3-oxoacyl-[acyl-carrier-protein] reductase [Dehalococcoidia bacterium]|nr:3-oxoacyl-[acyl-carrier-protein] reductase [Dehalococcoidia bacterium]
MKELSGKVALVTGASRGIGRAIAIQLAQDGAKVAVNYLSNEVMANAAAESIRRSGGEALVLQGDVGDSASVDRMMQQLTAEMGPVDILVNNAGIIHDTFTIRMSEKDWDSVIQSDLKGAFLCTKACLRHMIRRRWGRIVNISSVAGITGNPGQANYSAAKAGVIGFTKSVAREIASRNITVNAVAPGLIETDIIASIPKAARDALVEMIPLGKPGTAEDVAAVVSFLSKDIASYITGQVIQVDGGLAM